jgi:lipopolysaccharide/colanic/teichoic acid biosynthesis glycosyltransferase
MRKRSIDDLPQLLNVLKGDMSLVGPRPCLPYEWEKYAVWHKRRLTVTPGCTGLWQVLGRSEVGLRDMVILDLFYIYNISFALDVWLILKTIPVMIFGSGGK